MLPGLIHRQVFGVIGAWVGDALGRSSLLYCCEHTHLKEEGEEEEEEEGERKR